MSEVNIAVLEQNALVPESAAMGAPLLDGAARGGPSAAETEDFGALYEQHRQLLMFIGSRKFRIPECDAENLIQEVFLSLLQVSVKIGNVRSWLVAAMCNASRHYWRAQGRTETLPDDIGERGDPSSSVIADKLALQLTIHQSLNYLKEPCRRTLWLHYFEGRSAADVARELGHTVRYAEKKIHTCLKRVREIYMTINRVNTK